MERYDVRVDLASGRADVLDGISAYHNGGKSVPAAFKRMNDGRYKLSWRVDGVQTDNMSTTRVTYALRLNPSNLKADVSAKVQGGGTQNPNSRGRCQKVG